MPFYELRMSNQTFKSIKIKFVVLRKSEYLFSKC